MDEKVGRNNNVLRIPVRVLMASASVGILLLAAGGTFYTSVASWTEARAAVTANCEGVQRNMQSIQMMNEAVGRMNIQLATMQRDVAQANTNIDWIKEYLKRSDGDGGGNKQ